MNFSPAFLHGEQMLVGLGLAAIIAFIVVPLLLYVWLWHTQISEVQLAVAYFISTAVLCGFFAFTTYDPPSILSFTAFALAFVVTLPWNALAGWLIGLVTDASTSDRQFAAVMLLGAGINAVLVYFAAIKMRRLIR